MHDGVGKGGGLAKFPQVIVIFFLSKTLIKMAFFSLQIVIVIELNLKKKIWPCKK